MDTNSLYKEFGKQYKGIKPANYKVAIAADLSSFSDLSTKDVIAYQLSFLKKMKRLPKDDLNFKKHELNAKIMILDIELQTRFNKFWASKVAGLAKKSLDKKLSEAVLSYFTAYKLV